MKVDSSGCRLLSNFQSNLEEVTIIAMPEESDEEGQHRQAKSVQLHSFVDPAKGGLIQALSDSLRIASLKECIAGVGQQCLHTCPHLSTLVDTVKCREFRQDAHSADRSASWKLLQECPASFNW